MIYFAEVSKKCKVEQSPQGISSNLKCLILEFQEERRNKFNGKISKEIMFDMFLQISTNIKFIGS